MRAMAAKLARTTTAQELWIYASLSRRSYGDVLWLQQLKLLATVLPSEIAQHVAQDDLIRPDV